MNAGPFLSPRTPDIPFENGRDIAGSVLGALLHSLSQPLTSLRCSLELSLEDTLGAASSGRISSGHSSHPSPEHSSGLHMAEVAERQQESIAAALQQTETVIGMIQLMREYVDAGQAGPRSFPAGLAPALETGLELTTRRVVENLATIAAVRGVRLRLTGSAAATMPVPESGLRRALQYLITALIETQPARGTIMLWLRESPAGAMLRAEGEPGILSPQTGRDTAEATLRRVRLAIARRVLEKAGASLVFGGGIGPAALDHAGIDQAGIDRAGIDRGGFVLRFPAPDSFHPRSAALPAAVT